MLRTVLSALTLGLVPLTAYAAAPDGDVEWDGLYADTTPAFASPHGFRAGDTITLRLRSWAHDLTAAECRVYLAGPDTARNVPMAREPRPDGSPFDHWRCEVAVPADARAVYHHFAVTDGADTDYLDAGAPGDGWSVRGVTDTERAFHDFRSYPGVRAPDWARGAVFYQIFPDRFFNAEVANDRVLPDDCVWYLDYAPAGAGRPECASFRTPTVPADYTKRCLVHERWDEAPTGSPCDFFGGDLDGITHKLEYIRDLGATAVYLNPIFRSPSNHKYDTMSFDVVDPRFGGNAALDTLVQRSHAAGLAVIADGVFNHVSDVGDLFGGWQNYQLGARAEGLDAYPAVCGAWEDTFLRQQSPSQTCESPYRDWFRMELANDRWDVDRDGNRDEPAAHPCGWAGLGFMPELDYGPPQSRADSGPRAWLYGGTRAADPAVARTTVAGKWLADGQILTEGLDGWRLDVPDNAGYFNGQGACGKVAQDPTIWQGFRTAVKALGEDKYISGEIWTDANEWFERRTYDAVMNYHFFAAPLGCLLSGLGVHGDANECAGPYAPMTAGRAQALAALDTHLAEQRRLYPADAYLSSMNLLSSHDSWRFGSRAATSLPLATLLQLTLPGAAMIYYGDELGVEGPSNELGRATMPWSLLETPEHPRVQLREHVRRLTCLRRTQPALATGSFVTLHLGESTYGFGRFQGDSRVLVLVNTSNAEATVEVDTRRLGAAAAWVELAHGRAVQLDGTRVRVALPALSGAILVPGEQADASASCAVPNRAPTAQAGADRVVGLGEVVLLDARASRDPEGRPLTAQWRDAQGAVRGSTLTAEVRDLPEGAHVFRVSVSDGVYGASDEVTITVQRGGGPDPRLDAGTPASADAAVPSGVDAGSPAVDGGADAGVTAPTPEPEPGSGCGCTTGRSTDGALGLVLLALGLALARRRG